MLLTTIASETGGPFVRQATADDFAMWRGEGNGSGRGALLIARTEAASVDGLCQATVLPLEVFDDLSDRLPAVLCVHLAVGNKPVRIEHL
jgi:hypothetical protein